MERVLSAAPAGVVAEEPADLDEAPVEGQAVDAEEPGGDPMVTACVRLAVPEPRTK